MPPLAVGAEREEVRSSVARSLFFLLLLASLLSINGSVITLFSPHLHLPRSQDLQKGKKIMLFALCVGHALQPVQLQPHRT